MLLRCIYHRLADYEADALASGGLYSAAQIAGILAVSRYNERLVSV